MKKLEAIVKPYQLDLVREFLAEFSVQGMTVTEVKEWTRAPVSRVPFQIFPRELDWISMVKIEVLALDTVADTLAVGLAERIGTAHSKSLPLMVLPVLEAYRIRTAETVDE